MRSNWLRDLWNRTFKRTAVPLIDRPVAVPHYDDEERRTLYKTLATHPGFEHLVGTLHNERIRLQRPVSLRRADSFDAILANAITLARQEEARYWSRWLESRVIAAIRYDQLVQASDEQVPASQER